MEIYNRKSMQPLKIAINMKWKSIQTEYGNLFELRCKKVKTKENCQKHLLIYLNQARKLKDMQSIGKEGCKG